MTAHLKTYPKYKGSGLVWLGLVPLMEKGIIEPFSRPDQIDIWRMHQFYETARGEPKLATLLRELPWVSNRLAETAAALDKENQGDDAP